MTAHSCEHLSLQCGQENGTAGGVTSVAGVRGPHCQSVPRKIPTPEKSSVSTIVAGNDHVAIFTQSPDKQTKELVISDRLDKIRLSEDTQIL